MPTHPYFCFFLLRTMPYLTLPPGFDLHYLDAHPEGTRTALLLHGLGVHAGSWELQTAPLTRAGFRVIAPDLRGFGKSGYPGKW